MPLPSEPSLTLVIDFSMIAFLTVLVVMAGVERVGGRSKTFAGVAFGWMALTGVLAASGVLAHFDPPRMLPVLLLTIVGVVVLVRSESGTKLTTLPLALIVGFQGFRILVEFGIHRAAIEGVAPMEMSWSGWNYDVVTGLSAVVLAPFADRVPRVVLHLWNGMGLALLAVVVGTGLLSMPSPFQQIETDPVNVWITHFPFVWLPTIMVAAALIGHGVLWRRLRADASSS
jgi:hypothetical protein